MYRINLTLTNAMTGDSVTMTFQFDPATLTQAKWNAAFPSVQAQLVGLQQLSTPKEPATW
jgi:hypothetical protein